MPQLLEDLHIDRVDLVDEGANSAAFIELYKRKGTNSMDFDEIIKQLEPEHAAVITAAFDKAKIDLASAIADKQMAENALSKAKQDLATAQAAEADAKAAADKAKQNAGGFCTCKTAKPGADNICQICGKPIKPIVKGKDGSIDDSVLKGLPEGVQAYIKKCRQDAEDTKAQLAEIAKAKEESDAIAKASTLKALPVDTKDLVTLVKQCDENTYKILQNINKALSDSMLTPIGKSSYESSDAYDKLEAKTAEIRKSKPALTYEEAFDAALKENPELYEQYKKGE